jgi:DNA-binding transcriptional LysR family regulator
MPVVDRRPRLRLTPLGSEPFRLTCRPDHPLAARDSVSVRDLEGERFVETPPGWLSRIMSDAAFAHAGITRSVVAEADAWEIILELIEAGVGIGFTPAEIPSRLQRLTVEDLAMERRLYLILPPAAETNPVAAAFAESLTAAEAAK